MTTTAIEGKGVFLRPARPGDWLAWCVLRLLSARYLAAREPMWTEAAHSQERFERRLEHDTRAMSEGRHFSFLIFVRGEMVGGVELGPIMDADKRRAFLGTWVAEDYAGRGYALRAAEAVVDFGFDDLGLESIDATVLPSNTPSVRVLRYLGFKRDDERIVHMTVQGEPRRHDVYSLTQRGRAIRKARR